MPTLTDYWHATNDLCICKSNVTAQHNFIDFVDLIFVSFTAVINQKESLITEVLFSNNQSKKECQRNAQLRFTLKNAVKTEKKEEATWYISATKLIKQMTQTRQPRSRSETALRPMLAAAMISSWWPEFPAATAFAVASVSGRVRRTSSSTVIFCSKRSTTLNACVTHMDVRQSFLQEVIL